MFWAGDNRRMGLRVAGCVPILVIAAGCGRPQGPLFARAGVSIVWPRPPETARISWVGQLGSSADLRAAVSATEAAAALLRGPRPPIQFTTPNGVARSDSDMLAVTDSSGSAVHLIDLKNRTHTMVSGWGGGRLGTPVGVVWVDRRLFLTDAALHSVIELDADGRFVKSFGGEDLARPVGIAYAAERERLYVVDGGGHDLAVFTPDGELVSRIGGAGVEPGRFNYPTHIARGGVGRLIVADTGNFRVQIVDLDGASLGLFGRKGDGAGDLALPKGVAVDRDGHLYVVDAQFENVQIFEPDGRLLLAFGEEGEGAGEFSLPAGITIDSQDRIWVADSANGRVQVFEYLGSAG